MFRYSHPYLQTDRVAHDLGSASARDPWGHRLHVFFGLLWCFFVPWPTSFVEIASIPLIVFFLLRTPNIWRTWGSFAVQPLFLLIVAWVAWQTLSLAWSPDPSQGLREVAANRWVWVLWMLWPVIEYRRWLIAALALGFLCGNLAQLGHAIGTHFDIGPLQWPRLPDRNSGWWDPVIGGSLLVGALGLHLPAAVMGQGRWRWFGLAGAGITLPAIFATGTRGAWLAAAGLCLIAATIAVARIRPVKRMAALAAIVLVAAAIVIASAWALTGGAAARRAEQAWAEIDRALATGDYNSDTGARIFMAATAVRAVRDHPIRGLGAGGYRAYLRDRLLDLDPAHGDKRSHAHAHNAALHIAATTGLIGLVLATGIVLLALRGAFSELGPLGPRTGLGSYAAAPAFGLLGLLLVSMFDPVHLNAQTGALLATLMAMSLISKPAAK